ncbi:GTPase HflX [Dyadobacter arcticus]|uniref:GTPase HflX n=1 Tax=Dyadobacter arcticus TaxID=1078754 RepID=A0ABX0UQC8_9BACT|nr:GTPase HflX [Dyadobacter arcticus]NIJ55186.1 GTP-binding protein HflX [Dyadobacter arcticus]
MGRKEKLQATTEPARRAILVAVSSQKQAAAKTWEYLDELSFLAKTIRIETVCLFTQNLLHPDARTYTGKGKLEELRGYILAYPVDMIIYDDELTPLQFRSIEKAFPNVRILDRGLLILEVFNKRATSARSKLQVQLARLQYLYPRLARNQPAEGNQGSDGKLGKSGETELENSRQTMKDRIALLKDKLKKTDQQSVTQRQQRNGIVRVTLVGYTNVGKSTLMRHLSKADVYIKNELFATVDSTVRNVQIDNLSFLLTDTVGFIRKLPELLIDSFKSTLDEVREADILLHVADISHPACEEQIAVVQKTLAEIGADQIATLLIYNKTDLLKPEELEGRDRQQPTEPSAAATGEYGNEVFISVEKGYNMQNMHKMLAAMILEKQLHMYAYKPPVLIFNHNGF